MEKADGIYSLKGNPRLGLSGATFGFFAGFAAVALFGPTANGFKEAMHLTPLMVGLLVAMPSLSGSLLRIPFGAWVDTTGGRKPFLYLLWLSVTGMFCLSLLVFYYYPRDLNSKLYPLLLALGMLSGCGIATFSVGIGQVSYWFPQNKQGVALGSYAGLGNLAPGFFSFLLPVVLESWGLAGAYIAWLIFLLAGAIVYSLYGSNAWYFQMRQQGVPAVIASQKARQLGQEIFPQGNAWGSLINAGRFWKTWLLVSIYFTSFGGFIAMTAWLPTYWKNFYEVSGILAGMLTAFYSLTASVTRVMGGSLSDRMGGEQTAMLALGCMLAGAIVMTFSHHLGLSVVGVVLMALGMGVCNAAVFKMAPQFVPQAVGGAAGWIGGLGAFGGFAIPPILGIFVSNESRTGYAAGFITFVILAILSLGLAWALKYSLRVKKAKNIPGIAERQS